MGLVINEDNLQYSEVQEFSSKVRAILIDENNQMLIANYGNVILLPGGKVDEGETLSDIQINCFNVYDTDNNEYTINTDGTISSSLW